MMISITMRTTLKTTQCIVMDIGSLILLMFSGLGALNGLFLSLYFFTVKPKGLSNKFLAAMLFMISIRILKSVLYYFNAEIAETIL